MTWTPPRPRPGRERVAVVAVVAAWFGALFLKHGDGWLHDTGDRVFVATGLGLLAVALVASRTVPAWRRSQRRGGAALQALRDHRDPGPELRDAADQLAGRYGRNSWGIWLWPFFAMVQALSIDWLHPYRAAAAAVLFAAAAVAAAYDSRRLARTARRWLADPPGPPRGLPGRPALVLPPETWTTGWRLPLLSTALVSVGVAISVLAR